MGIVTVNKIRDGVISTLAKQFPDIDVYGEAIKEGLEPPYFFIKLLNAKQDQALGCRYLRYHAFDVIYFDDTNRKLHDMANQLYDTLELFKIDGNLYRGTGMRHEIIDGVLHFFVNYDFHVIRLASEEVKMKILDQEGLIK